MTPAALKAYRRMVLENPNDRIILDQFETAQHFYIADALAKTAVTIARPHMVSQDETAKMLSLPRVTLNEPLPMASRLPADWCTFEMPKFERNNIPGFLVCIRSSTLPPDMSFNPAFGMIADEEFVIVEQGGKNITPMVGFTPGSMHVVVPPVKRADQAPLIAASGANFVLILSAMLELMNAPNVTERVERTAPRAQRRRASREGLAIPATSYRIVRFRGGQTRFVNGQNNGEGRGTALHYRRGHWRRPTSRCKHPERLPGVHKIGGEWRNWIEGLWVGDPAHGICLHSYEADAPSEAA